MRFFLAFDEAGAEVVKSTEEIAWSCFASRWPEHYHKKWIPLAPTKEEAVRRFYETSRRGRPFVLSIELPKELFDSGDIVKNPGSQRSGADYTDTAGHFLYGRVTRDMPDPVLRLPSGDYEWVEV